VSEIDKGSTVMHICKTGCLWICFNANLINKMSMASWCYSIQSQHINYRARKQLARDSKFKQRQKKEIWRLYSSR